MTESDHRSEGCAARVVLQHFLAFHDLVSNVDCAGLNDSGVDPSQMEFLPVARIDKLHGVGPISLGKLLAPIV